MEPYARFRTRVLLRARAIAAKVPRAVVITHGGVLRVFLEEAMGRNNKYIIANTALYCFDLRGDSLTRVLEDDSSDELSDF